DTYSNRTTLDTSLALPTYLCTPNLFFFFFHQTTPTDFHTLSLHDALPIYDARVPRRRRRRVIAALRARCRRRRRRPTRDPRRPRSEEHTSELQSHLNLVCRLLLEKKNRINEGNTFCCALNTK